MPSAASPALVMAVFLLWNTLSSSNSSVCALAVVLRAVWAWLMVHKLLFLLKRSLSDLRLVWSYTVPVFSALFIFLWQLWYFFLIYLLLLILVFLTVFHILSAFLTTACFTLCRNFKQIDKSLLLLRCSAIIIK